MEYLGDGVYVSHDGYQIWLTLDPSRPNMLALDYSCIISLNNFAQRLWGVVPGVSSSHNTVLTAETNNDQQ